MTAHHSDNNNNMYQHQHTTICMCVCTLYSMFHFQQFAMHAWQHKRERCNIEGSEMEKHCIAFISICVSVSK